MLIRYYYISYESWIKSIPTASKITRERPLWSEVRQDSTLSNFLVINSIAFYFSFGYTQRMASASVSYPYLPALPIIYLYCIDVSSLLYPYFMLAIITLFAGRLTPAARVEVQKITFIRPFLKSSSTTSLSSELNPLWW